MDSMLHISHLFYVVPVVDLERVSVLAIPSAAGNVDKVAGNGQGEAIVSKLRNM